MCGISGIIYRRDRINIYDLEKMVEIQNHRGPDSNGTWLSPNKQIGFGHNRLSIIDLSNNASQPMVENNNVITFNGEIYNFKSLGYELRKKGQILKSSSDTEVLLKHLIPFEPHKLNDLDGMFSFGLFDINNNNFHAARDRFGEKPFHYYMDNEKFIFSSEIKGLWAAGVKKQVCENRLFEYLANNEITSSQNSGKAGTFYENIQKLEPGKFLSLDINSWSLKKENYYNPKITKNNITETEASHELKRILTNSVQLRLQSDVNVGSSLSGGVDSSILVSLIQKNISQNSKQHTFSAVFDGFEKNEKQKIDLLSTYFDLKNDQINPEEQGFSSDFDKLSYHQDEPFGSGSIYAQYLVYKLAKEKNITVLLDGQGADEIFAGYPFLLNVYMRELKRAKNSQFKNELINYNKTYGKHWNKPLRTKIQAEFPEIESRISQLKQILHNDELFPFIEKNYQKIYLKSRKKPTYSNNLNNSLNQLIFNGALEELLRYADRNSMANSVEVRLPFLDHKLVEFALSLPNELLIKDGFMKYILRSTFSNELPREILWDKKKIGFETPNEKWVKNLDINRFSNNKYFKKEVFKNDFFVSSKILFK